MTGQSRHSDYAPGDMMMAVQEGLAGSALQPGWIAMNLLRDIAAAYRGLDFNALIQRYWEYQLTANDQKVSFFFETFSGNNLHFYPRGLVSFGLLDALLGIQIDQVTGSITAHPLKPGVSGPVLLYADWKTGTAPGVMPDGRIVGGCL